MADPHRTLALAQYQDFVHSDNWLSCAGHRGGHVDPDPSLKDFECGGPDDAQIMTQNTGTKLGRYEIRSKLGEGGMGEVYLAQDTKLDRKVALKTLPASVAADRNRMHRFVQEAKAASALNHPNIITIHEIDETDTGHFMATEFIDGETLRERICEARQ